MDMDSSETTGFSDETLRRAAVPVPGQERLVRRRFWDKVRSVLGRVPFVDRLIAVYFAAVDPLTPTKVKAMLFAALAYFIVPTDLVPDFVLLAGFTDDLAVLTIVLRSVAPYVRPRHREQARAWLAANAEAADAPAPGAAA